MSETQDFPAEPVGENTNEGMAVMPAQGESQPAKEIEANNDGQSYFLGEVPQSNLLDPLAYLPLNSERLVGATNVIETTLNEVSGLIQEEVNQIQKHQRRISLWEERIEKNKALIQNNLNHIKQNNIDVVYDKKNRDYWWSRAEEVQKDYTHAEAANRKEDWAWLIKKYGLKNADGSSLEEEGPCVEELCNGETSNLSSEYRVSGNTYETARKAKEAENNQMIRENSKYLSNNEVLQKYIASVYTSEIEPLQDGVLLLKELGVKLKAFSQEGDATFGSLRAWAESFLDEFLKNNPKVPQSVVTDFRRLTSIPLPADHS